MAIDFFVFPISKLFMPFIISSMSCVFELLGLLWILPSFRFMLINNNIIILFCFIIVKSVLLTRIFELRPLGILWKFLVSSIIWRYVSSFDKLFIC